ncbi:hypothetical protein NM688_g686 [Phlebia brevispora]|uniref:Uncharacterized protein n=1 Tax=Phlebia brevispora TaxID=194682 RepID=A0ACC1TEE1_9APHY|nr:hypothetical protein NM688_g686 [Phlebia brevispora]
MLCITTFVFSVLAIWNHTRRHPLLSDLEDLSSRVISITFMRPLVMATLISMVLFCVSIFDIHARVASRHGLLPWISFSHVHANLSQVNIIQSSQALELSGIEASWWIIPTSSLLFMCMAFIGLVCCVQQDSYNGRSLGKWFRSTILRRQGGGDTFIQCSRDLASHIAVTSPTSPLPVHLKSGWDASLGWDRSTKVHGKRPSLRCKIPPIPSTSSDAESDASFKASTLTYLESPTGREASALASLPSLGSTLISPGQPVVAAAPLILAPLEEGTGLSVSPANSILSSPWPRPPSTIPSTPTKLASPPALSSRPPEHHFRSPSEASLTTSLASSTISASGYLPDPDIFLHSVNTSAHRPPFQNAGVPASTLDPLPNKHVKRTASKDMLSTRSLGSSVRRAAGRKREQKTIGAPTMDAGPSHSPHQSFSSESEEYSDADSEFDEGECIVDGSPQDGVYVEARAAASDYSDEYEDEARDRKGKGKDAANGTAKHTRVHEYTKDKTKTRSEETRSWSDLDVSMVIALLSPVGNWLTGGDHVKNLFLLLLLIFYLHQLIEVPWQLYKGSRSRVSARLARKLEHATDAASEAARLALSELHALELVYLSCGVVAPFLGAMLIRYVFAAMNGVDSLSWFSTTLFVLATGLRPWSHLVSRLRDRTAHLKETVNEPEREEKNREYERQLRGMASRVEFLERIVSELKSKTARISPLQEACDDLGEAFGDMERSVLRHERKVEAARIAHGSRISAVEHSLSKLEECQRKQVAVRPAAQPGVTGLYIPIHPRIAQAITHIVELPQKLHDKALLYLASNLPQQRAIEQPSKFDIISPTITPSHTHTEALHYFNGTPLETIPEADDSDSDGTYVSEKGTTPPSSSPVLDKDRKKTVRVRSRSRSRSRSNSHPTVIRPKSFRRRAFDWTAAIVSWPYRCAMKVLILVVPLPIQKLFV